MRRIEHKQFGQRHRLRPVLALSVVVSFTLVAFAIGPGVGAHDAGRSDEHGTMTLSFADTAEGCEVGVEARHVPVDQATLTIERPVTKSLVTEHEEDLEGTPEAEGDGFRYEAGPFLYAEGEGDPFQHFTLHWDDGAHALTVGWSTNECASDPYLRVHSDEESGAVTEVQGCTIFVEGRHIRHGEGMIEASGLYSNASFTAEVGPDDTTSEEEGVGNRFFVPVTVDLSGRYILSFYAPDEETPHAGLSVDVAGCSTEPPQCPPDVDAEAKGHANVITWDAVQDALSYRIYRGVDGGGLELFDEELHPITRYQDSDFEAGRTYEYRITAVGEVGESEGCPSVFVVRTAAGECPPLDPRAIANRDGSITIHADRLDREATLMRAAGDGAPMAVAEMDAVNDDFRDTDTEAGVTYTYTLVIDGETCATLEVTAIPVFSSVLAGGLAMMAGLVGYVAMRRRE
ncbi:MAG: fibronectin type III domain-containing protein [Euryarchaeota archaeon]|nr:fibronectin type III domain-containing protein [Euryarchaeota archaeon]